MKPQLTLEAFAEFCEGKPADEVYCYMDDGHCACAEYARSLGIAYRVANPISYGSFWERAEHHAISVWQDGAATYGALAARLRASA